MFVVINANEVEYRKVNKVKTNNTESFRDFLT